MRLDRLRKNPLGSKGTGFSPYINEPKTMGFNVCVRTHQSRDSVPKGRLRVAQHAVLGKVYEAKSSPV
jgi:hypothetical protein